jgi:hypothetical protein
MPSAVLVRGPEKLGPRQFHAPKRADLRGWWNAVRRTCPGYELGYYRPEHFTVEVFTGSIIFRRNGGSPWVLIIDRKASSMN